MSRVLLYLVRFAVAILGFFCAALAASVFLHVLLLGGFDWRGGGAPAVAADRAYVSIAVVTLIFAYMAFPPALLLVLAAEVFSWRGWLTYALAGGGIGLAGSVFTATVNGTEWNGELILALVAAGMVGGLSYWLVAGRTAGLALDRAVSGQTRSGS